MKGSPRASTDAMYKMILIHTGFVTSFQSSLILEGDPYRAEATTSMLPSPAPHIICFDSTPKNFYAKPDIRKANKQTQGANIKLLSCVFPALLGRTPNKESFLMLKMTYTESKDESVKISENVKLLRAYRGAQIVIQNTSEN